MTPRPNPPRIPNARVFLVLTLCATSLYAQTHKVAKPEDVVRAVAIYEYTGDMAKPNASRIIPITLFIDNKLQDAGVYLARPVPFALQTGNIYELDQAGVPKGTVDLLYARHFVPIDTATTTPFDDGWFGYGTFTPPAAPKKTTALKPSTTLAKINGMDDNDNDDKPHFSSKSATPGSGGSASTVPATSDTTPAADPDRPTMKRHTDTSAPTTDTTTAGSTPPADPDRPTLHRPAGSSDPAPSTTASTDSTTPAADPDRPTMKRHSDTSDQTASSKSTDAPADPDDPDRPTLRRRSPEDAKKAKAAHDQASVTLAGDLNDDPNRPTLHRGKPAGVPTETDFPKLTGLPGDQDLHQLIAVSDAANRPVHDFARPWDDEAEHQAILSRMQAFARDQLSAYAAATSPKPATIAPQDTRHPNSKLRRNTAPEAPAPPPEPLLDEQLHGYTLSYGGQPTYVYSAHTGGLGAAQRFVTLIAQVDMQGNPQLALKSVTDAAHLDRTPRYRFVDAVDAEASNRASLLFELRAQNARQFALYRVIGARADQTFLTGTTQ